MKRFFTTFTVSEIDAFIVADVLVLTDMPGISLTNSHPLVAPTYRRPPVLVTNLIAVAVPAGEEKPYVLVMATSIIPIGRRNVHQKSGQSITEGWKINQCEEVTLDPAEDLNGGALLMNSPASTKKSPID